jgi:hypothetical protein
LKGETDKRQAEYERTKKAAKKRKLCECNEVHLTCCPRSYRRRLCRRRRKEKVVELKKIANQTPLYPGFQKTGEKVVLKRGMVYFNTYFQSRAHFSDIKKFYDGVLAEKGWGPPQQPPPSIFVGDKNFVSYRRGDYVIDVEQDGSRRENFDIVFLWDPE